MNIDWSKAPKWAVAHGLHETGFGIKGFWLGETQHQNLEHTKSFPYGGGDPSCGSFHNSRRESFSYVTPRPAPWTGEGLPPVGTVCEMHRDTYFEIEWQAVTLLGIGQAKAFFRDKEGHEWSRPLSELSFRPIRTPEQIAEEEREAAHQELMHHIAGYMGRDNPHSADDGLAQYLLDHDYRKQSLP